MGVRVRKGGPQDVAAVLTMFDGAVKWLVARGSEGQWGSAPFSSSAARVEQARGWAGDDGALVRYYESVGFTPTERFMVDSWPGQLLECRLPPRQGAVR